MAAGLTDHRWELPEVLGERLPPERWKAPQASAAPAHDGNPSLCHRGMTTVACGATGSRVQQGSA